MFSEGQGNLDNSKEMQPRVISTFSIFHSMSFSCLRDIVLLLFLIELKTVKREHARSQGSDFDPTFLCRQFGQGYWFVIINSCMS